MMRTLRRLARRWANQAVIDSADQLRRQLIAAEARRQLQTQTIRRGESALNNATEELAKSAATIRELCDQLALKQDQIEAQADVHEEYRAQIDGLKRDLRHEKCASESRARITQAARALRRQAEQERDQAIKERDTARQRVTELENTIVAVAAQRGVLDEAWRDVISAGITAPEARTQ